VEGRGGRGPRSGRQRDQERRARSTGAGKAVGLIARPTSSVDDAADLLQVQQDMTHYVSIERLQITKGKKEREGTTDLQEDEAERWWVSGNQRQIDPADRV
jgi:hypothetical protein